MLSGRGAPNLRQALALLLALAACCFPAARSSLPCAESGQQLIGQRLAVVLRQSQDRVGDVVIEDGCTAILSLDRWDAASIPECAALTASGAAHRLVVEEVADAGNAARVFWLRFGDQASWDEVARMWIRAAGSDEEIAGVQLPATPGGTAATAAALASMQTQRRLQQASNCVVAVEGTAAITYGGCATLQGLPSPYKLYYTYDLAANRMTGAFSYPNPTGWVAFGLNPDSPGLMLGGSALVVKADAVATSGASIDSYYLGGYSSSLVQPPGRLSVLSSAAAAKGGQLLGAFTIELPAGVAADSFPFLYVFGPLAPDGELAQHQIQYGLSDAIDLTGAVLDAAVAPTARPTRASRTPRRTPAPAAAPTAAPVGAGTGPGDPAPTAAPTAASASTSVITPSNATGSCRLRLGGTAQTFDACTSLSGTPGAYTFMWSVLPGNKLRGAVDAVNPGGFVGWGRGPGGLRMVPGNGIIVKTDSTAASGASAADYTLGGYTTSAVTQPSSWTVTDIEAAAGSGGRLMMAFTLQLDAGEDPSAFNIIYTMGPTSNGVLLPHPTRNGNTATLDLTSATVTGQSSGSSRRDGDLPTVHGWLNAVGLGLLLPLAASIAATLREYPKAWFNLHRIIAVLGYCLGIAGIGIGYYMQPFVGSEEVVHLVLGSIALGLGFLQIAAGVVRPHPDHKRRWMFRVYHANAGRLLIALVIANVYIGVHMSNHIASGNRKNWYIVYSIGLAAIFTLAFAKELYNLAAAGNRRGARREQAIGGTGQRQRKGAAGSQGEGYTAV